MTVEEKNRDISIWADDMRMVVHASEGERVIPMLKYHSDWNALLNVWSKLRGELHETGLRHKMGLDGISTVEIEKEIAVYVDIKTAHSLIHSAIEWLNKNKA